MFKLSRIRGFVKRKLIQQALVPIIWAARRLQRQQQVVERRPNPGLEEEQVEDGDFEGKIRLQGRLESNILGPSFKYYLKKSVCVRAHQQLRAQVGGPQSVRIIWRPVGPRTPPRPPLPLPGRKKNFAVQSKIDSGLQRKRAAAAACEFQRATKGKGNGESEEEASSSSNPDGSRGNRARQGRRAGAARGARPGREAPAESGAEPAGGLEDSLKGAAAPGGSRGLPARRPEGRRGRLRGGRIARGQLHADIATSVGNEDEVAAPTSSLARRARQAGQAARGNQAFEEEASSSSNPDGSRGNRARQGRRAGAARGARPGREAPAETRAEPAGGAIDLLKGAAAPDASRGLPARRAEGRRGRPRGRHAQPGATIGDGGGDKGATEAQSGEGHMAKPGRGRQRRRPRNGSR
ncbi:uncharacterized protein LOC144093429 [Amblyomma americanum]